ncbi:MAG: twin-arginine translocase TatA/TatE family subunit [bacterium]|nr:twin-arginine translocase TatA/TatE family subunit [bacterium]
MSLGSSELFLVLLVVLLLFGGKRLPETARQLGRGIAEMRRSYLDIKREVTDPQSSTTPKIPPTPPTLNAPANSQPRNDTPEPPQAS